MSFYDNSNFADGRRKNIILLLISIFFVLGLTLIYFIFFNSYKSNIKMELNIFSSRNYDIDNILYDKFYQKTGIKVNVLSGINDDMMLERLYTEGLDTKADLLITRDIGRVYTAKLRGILESLASDIPKLRPNIAEGYYDKDGYWFALTRRARCLVYNPSTVDKNHIPKSWEDLMLPYWKNKILVRSSENIYNQSLLSWLYSIESELAVSFAMGIKNNMARVPKGNDRDQIKALLRGEGGVAIVNSYYLSKLINSTKNSEMLQSLKLLKVVYPVQKEYGSHVNVSAIAKVKNNSKESYKKEAIIKFIQFLTETKVQSIFASANYEYPVNVKSILENKELNSIYQDLFTNNSIHHSKAIDLETVGKNRIEAMKIFEKVSWDKGPDNK